MEALFSSGFGIVIYFVFLFGIMWFIMVRPQRKREQAMVEMQDSIKVGDHIVTTSGLYGKVVDVVNDLFVVEFGLNRGIRIPIEKRAVTGLKEPELSIKRETPVADDESTVEDNDSKVEDKK